MKKMVILYIFVTIKAIPRYSFINKTENSVQEAFKLQWMYKRNKIQ